MSRWKIIDDDPVITLPINVPVFKSHTPVTVDESVFVVRHWNPRFAEWFDDSANPLKASDAWTLERRLAAQHLMDADNCLYTVWRIDDPDFDRRRSPYR